MKELIRFAIVAICATILMPSRASGVESATISTAFSSRKIAVELQRIYGKSDAATTTASGNFSDSVSVVGNEFPNVAPTATAIQDSTFAIMGLALRIMGSGSASATRPTDSGASERHFAESSFEAEFSLLNSAPYELSGNLTAQGPVPFGNSGHFDDSFTSVQLTEVGGPTLFSSTASGAFADSGILQGERTYRLRIDSNIFLQTYRVFNKTNNWSIDFTAIEVPEPSTCTLGIFCLMHLSGPRRHFRAV